MTYLSNRPGDEIPIDELIALEQLADLGTPLQYLRVDGLGLGLEYATLLGLPNLQQVTDIGATTTNLITNTSSPTFTYTTGKLTSIAYPNTTSKALTYNADGTLNTLTITYPDTSTVVKTMVWSSGVLQSISIV